MVTNWWLNHKNKVGKFAISRGALEHVPSAVQSVYGNCIIIDVERTYIYDALVYVAVSDFFKVLEPNDVIPFYVWELKREIEHGDVLYRIIGCREKSIGTARTDGILYLDDD